MVEIAKVAGQVHYAVFVDGLLDGDIPWSKCWQRALAFARKYKKYGYKIVCLI